MSSDDGRQLVRRLTGFALVPVLTLLSPLIALPVFARVATQTDWVSLTIGQSVGALGAIATLGGWMLAGPPLVAGLGASSRSTVYVDSFRHRCALFGVVGPIAAVSSALLAPDGTAVLSALAALATSSAGLAPSWYGAGIGLPAVAVLFDVGPRLVASVSASALLLIFGRSWLWSYPSLLLLAALIGASAYFRARRSESTLSGAPTRTVRHWQSTMKVPLAASTVAGLYTTLAVAVFASTAPVGQAAIFSSGYRMYQIALQAVAVATQATLSWSPLGEGANRRRLIVIGSCYGTVGIAGSIVFGVVGPFASVVLFGPNLRVPAEVCALLAAAFLVVSAGTFVSAHFLMPRGQASAVLASTVGGTVVGLPLLYVAGTTSSLFVAGTAILMAETTVLVAAVIAFVIVTTRKGVA